MIRFLADHCFDEDIVRAVKRRESAADILLARAVGLAEAEDGDVLAWAAEHGRVVLTHDRNTMVGVAVERIERGEPMSGLVVVHKLATVAAVRDDVLLVAKCTEPTEWTDRIEYFPAWFKTGPIRVTSSSVVQKRATGAEGARRPSGAEEGEAALSRGRCGGGSASPARRKQRVAQNRV